MFSKILGLVILTIISIFFGLNEKKVFNDKKNNTSQIKNCNKMNYEEANYIDNLDYADLNFGVIFNDERKWKKSLLSDNVNSYKNQKISEENLRIYSISKRHSGLIEL